jgi:hypothetical protein
MLRELLDHCAPRPERSALQAEKNQYAIRFADRMAELLALDLSPRMIGIEATTKRGAASVRGKKQLDVNFSTPQLGLALGISLKSVHLRETTGGRRYTHNLKRNEEELRIEASGYHKRQPYAVMVGVLCLPFDSCTDAASSRTSSSFGSWVRHLRPFAGRTGPLDEDDRFERLYIALYEPDGSDLRFFDIRSAPPKNGRPRGDGAMFGSQGRNAAPMRLLSYAEFLDDVHRVYLLRNSAVFEWADGESEPLEPDEFGAPLEPQ